MRVAYWTTNATDPHSEYIILIAFLLQQLLSNALQCNVMCTLPVLFVIYQYSENDWMAWVMQDLITEMLKITVDRLDDGTAMVRNICDYCQSTRRNIPEHLNIRGLASSDRRFLSFVRIYIGMYNTTVTGVLTTKNNEAEGQTVQHMRGLALAPRLHLWRLHTPRGRLCHKNCVPQRNSEEYMFLIFYLSLNLLEAKFHVLC
jgi:hypothetical protein